MNAVRDAFDQTVAEYYGAWFHYHPEAAVDAGVEGYADRLSPHGDDDIGALVSLNETLMAALDEISPDALDAGRRIDYRILYGAALIEHHELMEQDWRRRDPARFLPVQAIYQLTVRPVANLAEALVSRLERIPAHLRSARQQLLVAPPLIPRVWLQAAVQEAKQGAAFLRSLPEHPKVGRAFPNRARIAEPLERAGRGLDEFAHFLEQEIGSDAAGSFACGTSHYERILRHRHFIDCGAERLHRFGTRLFEQTFEQLREVTRRLRGDEDVAALAASLRRDHPDAKGLLGVYRHQMQAARRFLERHDLVGLPAVETLHVVDTPAFLRHQIPFAAYMQPAPSDRDQVGYYYVTPADDEEQLGEHNRPGIMHTCVHEAWPGHHLQFVTANQRPGSRTLPRLLNPSATLYEGWALYCEQLMREQGFLDRPEQEFILLRDRLWRALRVQLDVELQSGELSFADATARMRDALGFTERQASADLVWYTRAPGVPMGYALGWALINAARERLQSEAGDFKLRSFHDRLLAAGSVALPLALEAGFGADLRQAALDAVLGHGSGRAN
ncbi:MAG: DUF885 domain-containing protein [Gammaproteobacteria bacterium]